MNKMKQQQLKTSYYYRFEKQKKCPQLELAALIRKCVNTEFV